jgi:hypothetical protein
MMLSNFGMCMVMIGAEKSNEIYQLFKGAITRLRR